MKTIFIVDDEAMIRESLAELFADEGYRVMTASDGRQAVSYFADHGDEIDLTLLDWSLPSLSGEEVLKQLIQQKSDARVIIASGLSDTLMTEHMKSLGAISTLSKPFDIASMIQLVENTLAD